LEGVVGVVFSGRQQRRKQKKFGNGSPSSFLSGLPQDVSRKGSGGEAGLVVVWEF